MFRLHERLKADTIEVVRLDLCRVLLSKDARFPWLILVPMREGITEMHQLWDDDKTVLWQEIDTVSQVLWQVTTPDKMNVGALGNLVPQLHYHIIARRRDDDAWPGPVWGHGAAQAYEEEAVEALLNQLRAALSQE